MSDFKLTVGLEIHAELKTHTKMFCASKNDPDETRPNVNICPVCMGYPGTLPVINKEAVRSVLRLGVAVGGTLADYTEFDRKNYFYPDIPKGYQISQYKHPLISGGSIKGVALTRIHLEEDTARSLHDRNDQGPMTNDQEYSLVDFNRAGVPLMEMVTEPVIRSAEEAMNFGRELQLILQYLEVSDANMEKGEMRVEVNISVAKEGAKELGTKVEVKNINSFRAAGKSIDFEYERQVALLERGEKVAQETRGWNEHEEVTFSQRAKEESHDYRYFPDPDLPKLYISEVSDFNLPSLKTSLPELPRDKRQRLLELGISKEHVDIYVTQPEWGDYFERVVETLSCPTAKCGALGGPTAKLVVASNYITSELKSFIDPAQFAEVILMIEREELSSKGAKEVIKVLSESGGSAKEIAEEKNLVQINDREVLNKFVEEVLLENKAQAGNKNAPIPFLVGQAIKKSGGRGNPQLLKSIIEEILNSKS